ncbi:hypothetical protein ACOMHN_012497 [Nucella lapillus]
MTCTKNTMHLLTNGEIYMLVAIVVTGPSVALTTASSSPDVDLKETHFDYFPLNHVQFTEDVLMEVSARSQIECSKKCVETEGCVMCTFHSSPQGPPGHCRLHSQLQTAADGKQSMPGARSLVLRRCDGGYVRACDYCQTAVVRWANYTAAVQDCADTQGRLITAKSFAELDCVRFPLKKSGIGMTWLGADDMQEPGVFRWQDGTLLPNDSPLWNTGEPRKSVPGGNCVFFYTIRPRLLAFQCQVGLMFTCQKDLM